MAQTRQESIVGEEVTAAIPAERDWTLAVMAIVGGLSFLVIGLLTLSVFPMGGIIEAALGTLLLLALMVSMVRSAP